MKRRSLTPEEEKLWRDATSGDTPLSPRQRTLAMPVENHQIPVVRHTLPVPVPVIQSAGYAGSLASGSGMHMDRNTAERFRKGEMVMDATLDLHGMNRERAYGSLKRFIYTQYERGSRCLLVVTGKGIRREGEYEDKGILREMLPGWLEHPDIHPVILAFSAARPKHGGSGAFYVLLRRRR